MKVKKVLAVSSAVLIGTTSMINSMPTTAFAQENANLAMESPAENEVNSTVQNGGQTQYTLPDDRKAKMIYVKTFADNGGNGSVERSLLTILKMLIILQAKMTL